MEQPRMGQSFFLRTYKPNKRVQRASQVPITVEPSQLRFHNYNPLKINLAKVTLKNETLMPKTFSILPPSSRYFEVRSKENMVPPGQFVEIYVAFNPQRQKISLEDSFAVKLDGQQFQLHLPIECQHKQLSRPSSLTMHRTNVQKNESSLKASALKKPVNKARPSLQLKVRRSFVMQNTEQIGRALLRSSCVEAIQLFEEKYRMISQYVLQKSVKNEVYHGEQGISEVKKTQIGKYYRQMHEEEEQRVMKEVISRYAIQYHSEGPVMQMFANVQLTWNPALNTPSITFNNALRKLQDQAGNTMEAMRFKTIHNSLRIYQEYKRSERVSNKTFKIEQYVEYLRAKLQNNVTIQFEFEVDRHSLKVTYLPVDHDERSRDVQFEISQRIGFDNWVPMTVLAQHGVEQYGWSQQEMPIMADHLPRSEHPSRVGAMGQLFHFAPAALGSLEDLTKVEEKGGVRMGSRLMDEECGAWHDCDEKRYDMQMQEDMKWALSFVDRL